MNQTRRAAWAVGCAALGIMASACSTNDNGGTKANGTLAGGASNANTGGAFATGGANTNGGAVATGGGGTASGSGGAQSSDGSGGSMTGDACSSTAQVGLEVGMLIPDVELQQCDGTWVNLHDLVCARGAVVTQVYSYAGWCPGCQGFSGLTDGGFSGNDLYDSYHDDGYEQVIIYSNTSNYGETPTQEDCNELQALHEGLVVFDAPGSKTEDVLGLRINAGTALVDAEGVWIVAPPPDPPQDGGFVEVFNELMSRFGF